MKPVTQKIGRVTVALGLVLFGAALLADNLVGNHGYFMWLARLWPLLLIGFGVEYLVFSALAHRRSVEGESVSLRFDIGGAILLLIVGLFSMGIFTFRTWVDNGGPRFTFMGGPSVSKTETRSVSLGQAKALQVTVGSGSVELQQNPNSSEVKVDATYTLYGINRSERDLDELKLNLTEGDTITVSADLPQQLNNVSIRFVVYAPPGLKVKTNTGAGSIQVIDYKGDLTLESGSGRIDAQSGSGPLEAHSGAGSIQVQNWEGPVTAKASVGSLDIVNVTGDLLLDSGTGTIAVREFAGGKLSADARTGRIDVRTSSPLAGDVMLKTSAGSVSLDVPQESSMRVTAQTRAGSLSVPSFMGRPGTGPAKSSVGTSGDGNYTVTLEAGTGSIHFTTH